MKDDITRVSVILDDRSLEWLNARTSRFCNRSRLIRDLVHQQIETEEKANGNQNL